MNNIYIKEKLNRKGFRGFTLLETMISISVLMFALVSIMSLASSSIAASSISRNRLIATMLAQEGMEMVITQRDSNSEKGDGWLEVIKNECTGGWGCKAYIGIDANLIISSCNSPGCPAMKFDTGNNYYNYGVGDNTIFTRDIKITDTLPPHNDDDGKVVEKKVIVTVSWTGRYASDPVVLEANLFDWR